MQFTRTVKECVNRCAQLRQQGGDMRTRPLDRLNLGRKITNFERAGNRSRQAVQSLESLPNSFQPASEAVAAASQVFGERSAKNLRIEDNRILSHVGQGPRAVHAIAALCQPLCHVPCHAEGLRPALAKVRLGEYDLSLRRTDRVVTQHMPTIDSISDACDRVVSDWAPSRYWIGRGVDVREHSPHVSRIPQASKLGESRVQRRHLDMHAPLRNICHQPQKGRRHAASRCFGLYLFKTDDFFLMLCVCLCSPGYGNRSNLLPLRAFSVRDKGDVMGRDLASGLESHLL